MKYQLLFNGFYQISSTTSVTSQSTITEKSPRKPGEITNKKIEEIKP
jgi:hypothetical protein